MLVPCLNRAVTSGRSYRGIERRSARPGIPPSERSTGKVTYCSTSNGERAGAGVMICTWTFVTSGTASMGSFAAAIAPATARSPVPTSTRRRLRRLQRTAAPSTLLLLSHRRLEHGGLESVGPGHDDLLPWLQAREHGGEAAGCRSQRHLVHLEVAVRLPHEDRFLFPDLRHRAEGHHHLLTFRLRRQRHSRGPEKTQPHFRAGIVEREPGGQRARLRIDLRCDPCHARREAFVRVSIQPHFGRGALANLGEILRAERARLHLAPLPARRPPPRRSPHPARRRAAARTANAAAPHSAAQPLSSPSFPHTRPASAPARAKRRPGGADQGGRGPLPSRAPAGCVRSPAS